MLASLLLDEDRYLGVMHVALLQALPEIILQLDGGAACRLQLADEWQSDRATQRDTGFQM